MRLAALLLALFVIEGCDRPSGTATAQGEKEAPPADTVSDPAPADEQDGAPGNLVSIPEDPPEDPALADLSSSRRNEYRRGYRDCRNGEFNYDAQTQGEYYRIGCMAAENLKAAQQR